MAQTPPDFGFLSARCGIHNWPELQRALDENLAKTDLRQKHRDFEHLLFAPDNSKRILQFTAFFASRKKADR